jgi:hypothetical protein
VNDLNRTEQTLQRTRVVAPQQPSPLNLGFGILNSLYNHNEINELSREMVKSNCE